MILVRRAIVSHEAITVIESITRQIVKTIVILDATKQVTRVPMGRCTTFPKSDHTGQEVLNGQKVVQGQEVRQENQVPKDPQVQVAIQAHQ